MPKPKKLQLSKEQIAQQMKMRQEADRFKKLIRESVYPILQKSGSLINAQQVCEIMKTVMMTKVNAYWADKTVADLGLAGELDKDASAKDYEIYSELIKAIEPLTITDAQKLLQGMGGVLDGYTRKIASEKKMEDIPVEDIIND